MDRHGRKEDDWDVREKHRMEENMDIVCTQLSSEREA
jgi:hypothetical protein